MKYTDPYSQKRTHRQWHRKLFQLRPTHNSRDLAGEQEDVKKKLEMRDPLTAPVDSGEELGKMSYYIGERCIGSVPIYAAEKVDSMSMKYAFVKVLKLQFTY
ncbi:MAG: hypothetical protein ACLTDF_01230 [Coprococcus sp.]